MLTLDRIVLYRMGFLSNHVQGQNQPVSFDLLTKYFQLSNTRLRQIMRVLEKDGDIQQINDQEELYLPLTFVSKTEIAQDVLHYKKNGTKLNYLVEQEVA